MRLASGIAHSFYPLYATWRPMRAFLGAHMTVAPLGGSEMNHYYCWNEIGLNRLPEPINWDENHLVKYGPDALLLDFDFILERPGAGLISHPVVEQMYRVDTADPIERLGCVLR